MTSKSWIVVVPGLEAESTTACPTRREAREVARVFRGWLKDVECYEEEKPVIYRPGDKLPELVAEHAQYVSFVCP